MDTYLTEFQGQILRETTSICRAYRQSLGIEGSIPSDFEFPSDGPISCTEEVQILNRLLNSGEYILIQTQNTVYTIGLWLLFGLPELVIDITQVSSNVDQASANSDANSDDLDDLDDLDRSNSSSAR